MDKIIKAILLLIITISCSSQDDKVRVYFVKKGYEGPLVLIQNDSASNDVLIKDDTMYFDFTETNIQKYKSKFIEGKFNSERIKYFYINNAGEREKINFVFPKKEALKENEVYVYLMYSQIRENSQCDLISTPKHFDYYLQVQQKFCDSLFAIHYKN